MTTKILICIPSFNRQAELQAALLSLLPLLESTKLEVSVYVYAQGYENFSFSHQNVHVENVPHVVRPIGGIMRDSVLEGLKHYDKNFDFIVMSDDDVELCGSYSHFEMNLLKVINHMGSHGVAIGGAHVATTENCFAKADFPREDWYVPFKGRFIIFNEIFTHTLLPKHMVDIVHGEDTAMFLEATLHHLRACVYYGLDGWVHTPHCGGPEVAGGFRDLVGGHANKYDVALAAHPGGKLVKDLYFVDTDEPYLRLTAPLPQFRKKTMELQNENSRC